tara:strand:- start:43 stop:345 length:303 start_codon:yes stop_codon:yes gene_type:complete
MSNLTDIKNTIELLPHHQQLILVEHLIKNDIEFTENKNGIFLNISILTYNQISIIKNVINMIKEENDNFNKVELLKEEFKKQLDSNILFNITDNISADHT